MAKQVAVIGGKHFAIVDNEEVKFPMKHLQKFALSIEPEQTIKMPYNADITGLTDINNVPYILAITEDGQRFLDRKFVIVALDKEVNQRCNKTNCIGYFMHKAEVGKHVLHVFEIT